MLIGEEEGEANGPKEKSLYCKKCDKVEKMANRENPHILTYQIGRWAD